MKAILGGFAAILSAVLLTFSVTVPAIAQAHDNKQPGDFDFYVLALSWSPSYCATEGPRANRQQCGIKRPYGFVVHGLWPQYERGYPSNCKFDESRSRGSYVPRQIISSISDIMPSNGLIAYQWRKHGSCSGLSQSRYFETIRKAYDAVSVPPSLRNLSSGRRVDPQLIEKAFISANPNMKSNGIAVTCKKNFLQEVRICMTKDLKFRSCPQVDTNACRNRSVQMPASR